MAVKATVKKIDKFLAPILAFITAIGLGGLFVTGAFLNVPLLSFLPAVAHVVVGWTMIVLAIIGLVFKFVK